MTVSSGWRKRSPYTASALLAAAIALTLLSAATLCTPPLAGAEQTSLRLVSDGPTVVDPNSSARFEAESADGSRVVFRTEEAMAPTDTDARTDLYLTGLGGDPVHVSDRQAAGPDAQETVFFEALSPDGEDVYFRTVEPLLASDGDQQNDIYAYTPTGLIHVSDTGGELDAPEPASLEHLSADGERAFFATAEAMVGEDKDVAEDVYMRGPGGTVLISDDANGTDGPFDATFRHASADGLRVYFETAETLAGSDGDNKDDAYRWSPGGAELDHVSDTPSGADGNFHADFRGESSDGGVVWLETKEPLLDTDTDTDVDVYARGAGTLVHLTDGDGVDGNIPAGFEHGSSDGSRVIFETKEPLANTDTDTESDLYQRVSGGPLVHLTDNPIAADQELTTDLAAATADGSRIVITTDEKLAMTDVDLVRDAYERTPAGQLIHVSANPLGGLSPEGVFLEGASEDLGALVLETKEALAATDTDASYDVYWRKGGTLIHASENPNGLDDQLEAFVDGVSVDASRIYLTTEENLLAADSDISEDVYVLTVSPDPPVAQPAPAGPPAPGGSASADATPPSLTKLRVAPKRLLARFELSEDARVRFTLTRGKSRPRTFTVAGKAGANTVGLRARLGKGAPRPGNFRLSVVATDAAGNSSASRSVRFAIKAKKGRTR